ncbi:MAG TPA: 16S rRNA (guanine(527)-N(7))-methyltransferase RsmG [Candidatus Onthenecus intestinigallinarum]|uniref:Ribosomal RNA small subunit methyltransferase G n=1 Tax=Candidatus Onthenecus intestinigallinarum TaxID=2840875 RepID=A0A9D0ZAV3_9FIRM|nr:16S rRNA (guanine(527)-N(7))-methyltransferase RsmG [Candidatus Onthenecus intestinigallinarum]
MEDRCVTERLQAGLERLGVAADGVTLDRLARYHALLTEWNARIDLTAVLEPEEMVDRHYLDSAAPLALGLIPQGARVIDVGTGAGLPGIPLCILRPDLRVTLLDAQRKRVTFLQAAIEALDLPAQAVHMRAEDAARDEARREAYDVAVSRAVAATPTLLELTLPFVRVGGRAIAWKGPGLQAELEQARRAAHLLGGALEGVLDAPVPGRDWQHVLLVCAKRQKTARQYPRRAGLPGKNPLG